MNGGLSQAQKKIVVDETSQFISLANQLFQKNYPLIAVQFDLTGHTIGMYKQWKNKKVIRYNEQIFSKYFEENVKDTVPHEVAHYIADLQYSKKGIRPHGLEWRSIMQQFGADASRTANYDLSGIPKRHYSTVPYRCGCQAHQLGIRRHNKVSQRKADYYCRHCGDLLKAV